MGKVLFRSVTKPLLLMVAVALPSFAQLQSVEMRVSGLDCASCVGSVEPRLKRVRGVASARFDGERAVAIVTLTPDNKVTLGAIRDALKGLGYTPGDADVVVSGTAEDGRLRLPNQPYPFILEKHNGATGLVRVEGTVPAATDTLRVRTITKQ